jgi:hypothetical protein
MWTDLVATSGNTDLAKSVITGTLHDMDQWRISNDVKFPDAPGGKAVEAQEEGQACDESECHDCFVVSDSDCSSEHELNIFRIVHVTRSPGPSGLWKLFIEVSLGKLATILVHEDFINTYSPKSNGYYIVNGAKKTYLSKEQVEAIF